MNENTKDAEWRWICLDAEDGLSHIGNQGYACRAELSMSLEIMP